MLNLTFFGIENDLQSLISSVVQRTMSSIGEDEYVVTFRYDNGDLDNGLGSGQAVIIVFGLTPALVNDVVAPLAERSIPWKNPLPRTTIVVLSSEAMGPAGNRAPYLRIIGDQTQVSALLNGDVPLPALDTEIMYFDSRTVRAFISAERKYLRVFSDRETRILRATVQLEAALDAIGLDIVADGVNLDAFIPAHEMVPQA